jgi:hypothetical protein
MTDRRPGAPVPDDAALEAILRDELADRGRTTNGDVRAILDAVPGLPERRSGGRRSLLAAAAAVGVLVLGGALVVGRLSLPGVGTASPGVGPAAFAADPRLVACEATTGPAAQVFEMTHAEWFPLYFPGWWKGAPELEVADPALVVIGPPFTGGILGGVPGSDPSSPAPTRPPSFLMCIAVGPPEAAVLHQYGPTWFDRIVPVLSDADVARAAHLDPDVLADPAAWPFPERLAPCGGVTGNELYIFEANPLSDFPRYFPSADPIPLLDIDLPGIVVVYRDPLAIPRPLKPGSPNPNAHDVCVILEADNAQPDHELLLDVDTTGFHLRIDRDENVVGPIVPGIATPTPPATPEPQDLVTPEPGPAWAGNAASALECVGSPRARLGMSPANFYAAGSPDQSLRNGLPSIRFFDPDLPDSGYVGAAEDPAARLYVRRSAGRTVAAVAIVAAHPGSTNEWIGGSIAACEPAEFGPSVSTGRHPFGIWVDATGTEAPTSTLGAREDCYGGTQVHFEGRLFVRTPFEDLQDQVEVSWQADVALPASAVDTGLRSGDLRLLVAGSGRALYVAHGDRAERLPHVIGDEVQRTDCN